MSTTLTFSRLKKEYHVFEDQTELHMDALSGSIYNTEVAKIMYLLEI